MSDVRTSGLNRILRSADLPTLPRRMLVSTWEVSLPVAFLLICIGVFVVAACNLNICLDRVWMKISLAGGFSSIAMGAAAYLVDLLFLDEDIVDFRIQEEALPHL